MKHQLPKAILEAVRGVQGEAVMTHADNQVVAQPVGWDLGVPPKPVGSETKGAEDDPFSQHDGVGNANKVHHHHVLVHRLHSRLEMREGGRAYPTRELQWHESRRAEGPSAGDDRKSSGLAVRVGTGEVPDDNVFEVNFVYPILYGSAKKTKRDQVG